MIAEVVGIGETTVRRDLGSGATNVAPANDDERRIGKDGKSYPAHRPPKSITARGVLVPVEKDDDGNILDGHHRSQICAELDIADYPVTIRGGMNEMEKRAHVRAINCARRHITASQKRALIADQLKDTPDESNRQIARTLGVDHHTVETVRKELVKSGEIPHFSERKDPRTGELSQTAHRPKSITTRNAKEEQKAMDALALIGWDDGNSPKPASEQSRPKRINVRGVEIAKVMNTDRFVRILTNRL
jgi:hypothetical protein